MDRPELEGAIIGRVCEDRDGDRRCSDGEPGFAGVRVVLETGAQAFTDGAGLYHLVGVSARAPDGLGGGRLLPGRHRIRVDTRALPPGAIAHPASATVELPMAGLGIQDFALTTAVEDLPPLTTSQRAQPPQGELMGPSTSLGPNGQRLRVKFLLAGKASPGDRISIDGESAEVDPDGTYRLWVELKPGPNELTVSAVSPKGALRVFVQRVDVVPRDGSVLVVPRELEPSASVQLPAGPGAEASSGPTQLRLRSLPGTRIRFPGGEAVVGPDGIAQLPVELKPGGNAVPLAIARPGQPELREDLQIEATPRPFVVGLLDLEATFDPARGGLRLFGRGGAHAEQRLGPFLLSGELDLRDQDLPDLRSAGPQVLASPRRPDRLERILDPEDYPIAWGDQSATVWENAPEGRLRLEAKSDTYGRAGFGTHRAQFADSEVGRYQRELFGPYLALRTDPAGFARLGVNGFFSPGLSDPTRALALAPAHEELVATGGSIFYLGHSAVSHGSEVVRVEVRDGLTGLPLSERHLVRGRDYEIDYGAGRILLARPLSFLGGLGPLRSEPLTSEPEQVLVVDYEHLLLGDGGRRAAGGEVEGAVGPVSLAVGAAQERGAERDFLLLRARASAPLGPLTFFAEAARSEGAALAAGDFGISDDGGLTFLRPAAVSDLSGEALGLRLRGPGLLGKGSFDAAFRRRTPGFADGSHFDRLGLRQVSLRAEQPLGPFVLGLLGDDRAGEDPRAPFSGAELAARTLGGSAGWRGERWSVFLDVKDTQLTAAEDPFEAPEPLTGGRTSVGLSGRFEVSEALALSAGHKQVLAIRGEGPGAFDDSFTSAGVELSVDGDSRVGLRGGWGPRLGPQVWGQAEVNEDRDTWYGGYSVDVDGPDFGSGRAVSGARTEAEEGTSVFVEDIAAHDATSIRLSRAVGVTQAVGGGFQLSARYERGVRSPLAAEPNLRRDTGGLTGSWLGERGRAFARVELRRERGETQRGPRLPVDLTQRVAGVGGELALGAHLHGAVRAHYVDSLRAGRTEARFLEGSAALAWRADPAAVIVRYAIERELSPPTRGDFPERALEVVSVMPALRLGDRFALAAGGHAGWSTAAGNTALVLSGSLRPSVKVVGGLEVAAEVAGRTVALDGGELGALRGELGYRFRDELLFAVGYTALGFSGLGLSRGEEDARNRLYLRAELGY